jgi:very-short-patch-repair endonuclease
MRNRSDKATNQAREFRKTMWDSEQILWTELRNRRQWFKFRRQYTISVYTLDFYCSEARLCVEVDGELHVARADRDEFRDAWLESQDILTIRIPSWDVFDHLDSTMERILVLCVERSKRKMVT